MGAKRRKIEWIRIGDCMIVTSHKERNHGYTTICIGGRELLLHRLICERKNGKSIGMDAMHSCDRKMCINPTHLSWGTRLENMKGAVERNRMPIGVNNKQSKLTDAEVIEIHHASGSQRKIARRFNISQTAVYEIKSRRKRKYIHR